MDVCALFCFVRVKRLMRFSGGVRVYVCLYGVGSFAKICDEAGRDAGEGRREHFLCCITAVEGRLHPLPACLHWRRSAFLLLE